MTGVEQPDLGRELGRYVENRFTVGDQALREVLATALSIINQGRTSFWNYHESGVADNATALKNINQAASGLAAQRSSYGTAPGGSVCLANSMLNGLYYVAPPTA